MKHIPLTQGKFAIVDNEFYDRFSKDKWRATKKQRTYYACRTIVRNGKREVVYMHRIILGLRPRDGKTTDHRNGHGLDNRGANVRICTNQQNLQNRPKQKNNTKSPTATK